MTVITESKDVDSIPVDELVGSLQSYELDLPKTSKSKSMALESVDDVAKNFRNFLRNNNIRQEVRTLLNLETLGRMIPLRLTTLKNLEKK